MRAQERDCSRDLVRPAQPVDPSTAPKEHDASWHGSPDKPRRTLSQDGRALQRPTPKSPQQMDGVAKHAANHAVSAVTSASCVVQPLRDSFKRRVTSGSERQAENQRGLSLEDPLPPFKDVLKRYFETQSQSTLSSQASVGSAANGCRLSSPPDSYLGVTTGRLSTFSSVFLCLSLSFCL